MTSRTSPLLSSFRSPTLLILCLAIATRLVHLTVLHILPSFIPLFDTSPLLVSAPSSISSVSPALRWDAIHFASIATNGYEYEQQLAFQPGWMGILRLAGEVVCWVRSGGGGGTQVRMEDVVLGGMVVSNLAYIGATLTLYKLTAHFHSPAFALLTSLFYLLPPTPITAVPYTEPTYALLTFTGFYLLLVKKQFFFASLFLAGGTSVRATGVFNAVALVWYANFGDGGFMGPGGLAGRHAIKQFIIGNLRFYIPTSIIISPFMMFQWYADASFCTKVARSAGEWRPWCDVQPRISYSFVQKEYWNIGLFNYWTLSQLPNILLALPILLVSLVGIFIYIRTRILPRPGTRPSHPALEGLYICHLMTTGLVLFNSHTQIALRVCLGDPVLWWSATTLAFNWDDDKQRGLTKVGKLWVGWCVVWGAVAMVLWVGHYPPA
ncbi:hypothetical protein CI109_102388 [Kwoniella shandongensis]|uniref:GPI mannosyltransferase 2 n=1 Tax=Kwoniella shandongensis TaxID=1734106 RepID=A0A5M6C3E9_9TREE|nr:uncharacterized protein CI109_003292 [Kwoniella shandongensis]KAA5528392.1 hypothetical protein CI109_003292 [Kwoniella shandongensis]